MTRLGGAMMHAVLFWRPRANVQFFWDFQQRDCTYARSHSVRYSVRYPSHAFTLRIQEESCTFD